MFLITLLPAVETFLIDENGQLAYSQAIYVRNPELAHEREEDTTMIKILLVEDDLGLSNSVFDFLDDFADVMQVFDGEEGLYEAESGIYDLILLDLMLPEKDGFHVLKELREKISLVSTKYLEINLRRYKTFTIKSIKHY